MPRMSLRQDQATPDGADMTCGPLEQVALDRLSGAKLTFTGRRIALHHLTLPWGAAASIALWAKQKSGFVIAFQVFGDEGLRPHAAGVETLDDAICFLEDFCTRMPDPVLQGASYEETLLTLQRTITFRTTFLTLVGEALADWIDLPQKTGRKTQQKATA